jgi:hypothetical protein
MTQKAVRRAVILFCLGLFINNGYDLYNWRVPGDLAQYWRYTCTPRTDPHHCRVSGVLQRFAVSYLAVALILIFAPYRSVYADCLSCSSGWRFAFGTDGSVLRLPAQAGESGEHERSGRRVCALGRMVSPRADRPYVAMKRLRSSL